MCSQWETHEERQHRMKQEHYEKYDTLAKRIGIHALKRIIPASAGEIRAALAKGDEHLNSIPLWQWDRAAGIISDFYGCCRLTWIPPFTRDAASGLSAAERVCVLKHVARYYLTDTQKEAER